MNFKTVCSLAVSLSLLLTPHVETGADIVKSDNVDDIPYVSILELQFYETAKEIADRNIFAFIQGKEDMKSIVNNEYNSIVSYNQDVDKRYNEALSKADSYYSTIDEFISHHQDLCSYYGINSSKDLVTIIATCYGEDTVRPDAVLTAIINRCESKGFSCYGDTLLKQVCAPYQFSAYGSPNVPYKNYYYNSGGYVDVTKKCLKVLLDRYYKNVVDHEYCSFRAGTGNGRVKIGSNYYFTSVYEKGGYKDTVINHRNNIEVPVKEEYKTSILYENHDEVVALIDNATTIVELKEICEIYGIDYDFNINLYGDSINKLTYTP